jgi:hypothetical protein
MHRVGSGWLLYEKESPAALSRRGDGADHVRGLVRRGCESIGLPYRETNYLALRRGPYVVAAGLDESLEGPPHEIRGHFVDLFDGKLPVLESVTLKPGSRHFLLDLDRGRTQKPAVLASACKALGAREDADGTFRFFAEGPDKVEAVARVSLPTGPKDVQVDDKPLARDAWTWDAATRTLMLRFPNAAGGRWVRIK